ncbi:hypothetical protein BGZ83_009506 [Gryganskiella cystojenkinii]|nr:hypothetical protein BGZ83_009506 [Gryganskiella cystojenkinii]
MLARNSILVLVVMLINAAWASIWNDKNLDNWDKGWDVNYLGEPIDSSTECDGRPCPRLALTKPTPPSANQTTNFCKPTNGKYVLCNHLPANHTQVDDVKDNRDLSVPEQHVPKRTQPRQPYPGPPLKSLGNQTRRVQSGGNQTHKSSPILNKRNRWKVDDGTGEFLLNIWSKDDVTYSIGADPSLVSAIPALADKIDSALNLWKKRCPMAVGFDILNYWHYVPGASKANVWFHLASDAVCGKGSAIACAFFPGDYPGQRTTVLINNSRFKLKMQNTAIKTLAHEIGHVLGLAHEEEQDVKYIWSASTYDSESIMHTNVAAISGISTTDCQTLTYYSNGAYSFPPPKACNIDGKCKNAKIGVIKPELVSPMSGRRNVDRPGIFKPTVPDPIVHSELLLDTDSTTCGGGDISQYMVIAPNDGKGFGWFEQDISISQCEAVQVISAPGYFYAMQSDGNFVSYNTKTRAAVWATGSAGLGTAGDYNIAFQNDGNLVIYDIKGVVIWSPLTHTSAPQTFRHAVTNWGFNADGSMYLSAGTGLASWGSSPLFAYQAVLITVKGYGYCLDTGGIISGVATMLYQCNGNGNQQWDISTNGLITNTKTGFCLDAFGKTPGSPVGTWSCNGGANQVWQLLSDGTIRNPASGMCLDSDTNPQGTEHNGSKGQLWGCNEQASQQWTV